MACWKIHSIYFGDFPIETPISSCNHKPIRVCPLHRGREELVATSFSSLPARRGPGKTEMMFHFFIAGRWFQPIPYLIHVCIQVYMIIIIYIKYDISCSMCMYVYIHTYIYIYIHTCDYIYINLVQSSSLMYLCILYATCMYHIFLYIPYSKLTVRP